MERVEYGEGERWGGRGERRRLCLKVSRANRITEPVAGLRRYIFAISVLCS